MAITTTTSADAGNDAVVPGGLLGQPPTGSDATVAGKALLDQAKANYDQIVAEGKNPANIGQPNSKYTDQAEYQAALNSASTTYSRAVTDYNTATKNANPKSTDLANQYTQAQIDNAQATLAKTRQELTDAINGATPQDRANVLAQAKQTYDEQHNQVSDMISLFNAQQSAADSQRTQDVALQGQQVTQRGQDMTFVQSAADTIARNLAPTGALSDVAEALKQMANPKYVPQYTNSAANTPFNPYAIAKSYLPPQLPSLPAAITPMALADNSQNLFNQFMAKAGMMTAPTAGATPSAAVTQPQPTNTVNQPVITAPIANYNPIPGDMPAPVGPVSNDWDTGAPGYVGGGH